MMIGRYIHHEEIQNVVGYVVNVHDAVNYDIDLLLPDELVKRYQNVITNRYTYCRPGDDNKEISGTTFRCRLKGIGINTRSHNNNRRPSRPSRKMTNPALREATISMIRQFDRFNGWVICTISDIDVYRRLLVTLYDPITRRDLREILFADPAGSFSPYLLDPNESTVDELSSESSESSESLDSDLSDRPNSLGESRLSKVDSEKSKPMDVITPMLETNDDLKETN